MLEAVLAVIGCALCVGWAIAGPQRDRGHRWRMVAPYGALLGFAAVVAVVIVRFKEVA